MKIEISDITESPEYLKFYQKILEEENKTIRLLLENEVARKMSASRELRLQYSKQDSLINSLPGMVVWFDSNLNYRDSNDYFSNLISLSNSTIKKRRLGECNESKSFIKEVLYFCQSNLKSHTSEFKFKKKSKTLHFLCIFQKINLTDNFSVVGIDNTARKELENELKSKNKDLEKILYISSHDLKSPILSIRNLVEWIEEDLPPDVLETNIKNINLIKDRANRAEAILSSLIDYHSFVPEKYIMSQLDISNIVTKCFSEVNIDEYCGTLIVKGKLNDFNAPLAPFEYIFKELFTNSLKHNPSQNIEIEVAYRKTGMNEIISVKDNGKGIPDKFEQKIFEPFQKLQSKDKVSGPGMGLTIVKKMIEKYGGKVKVNTRYKDGLEVDLYWPHLKK